MNYNQFDPDHDYKQRMAESVLLFLMLAFLAGFVSAL